MINNLAIDTQANSWLKTFIYESQEISSFLDRQGDLWFIENDISSLLG